MNAWICRYCQNTYRWDTSLMRHMKLKHLEEMKASLILIPDPSTREWCGDHLCPCQDGDACHYKNYPGSPAMVFSGCQCEQCVLVDPETGEQREQLLIPIPNPCWDQPEVTP